MHLRTILAIGVAAVLIAPVAAHSEPGYQAPPEADNPRQAGVPDAAGTRSSVGGEGDAAKNPASKIRTTKKCVTKKKVRTCRYYRAGMLFQKCVKKPGKKEQCTRVLSSVAVATGSGYEQTLGPAIGRSYFHNSVYNDVPYDGWCSGAFIGYGLFLTAAHCLYDNGVDSRKPAVGYDAREMNVVPGNTVDSQGRPATNYATWDVLQNYVPTGWKLGDQGLDWGIQVIAPNAQGRYPGEFTGTYTAYAGIVLRPGDVIYADGYPASGIFRTANYYFGSGQYYCNEVFRGMGWWAYGANVNLSSGTWVYYSCPMTGGSSGGPVFTQFTNGEWGIFGVINRGRDTRDQDPTTFVGVYQLTIMLDNRFLEFYRGVVNLVNSGSYKLNLKPTPSDPVLVG